MDKLKVWEKTCIGRKRCQQITFRAVIGNAPESAVNKKNDAISVQQ